MIVSISARRSPHLLFSANRTRFHKKRLPHYVNHAQSSLGKPRGLIILPFFWLWTQVWEGCSSLQYQRIGRCFFFARALVGVKVGEKSPQNVTWTSRKSEKKKKTAFVGIIMKNNQAKFCVSILKKPRPKSLKKMFSTCRRNQLVQFCIFLSV